MPVNSELEDLLMACYRSTKVAAKTFFPERFDAPFTKLHDEIFDLIDSDAPRIAIAAPRGMGKTSIVGLAKTAQGILFRDKHFIPYVSMSHDVAMLQTENLKRELVSNQTIKKLFGSVKTKSAEGMDESFSKKSWVAFDSLIMPRGAGQQLRGILFGNHRPDLYIVDDLEDPSEIENDAIRQARKQWFSADLLKSVSRYDRNWKIIYIDTLKHEDSLLQDLLDSPDWESVRLELCDDNLESHVPEFLSSEEIQKEYEYHKSLGQIDIFYREYRNLAIAMDDAVFQPGLFQYYDPSELDHSKVEFFVIVDPAKTVKLHSAESAIVGIGLDRHSQKIYFHDCVARKMYPDELYNEIFQMAARLRANAVGLEVTSLNEFITQPIRNEMLRRGVYFQLVELRARGGEAGSGKGKQKRVAQLAPYYRQGLVFHNQNVSRPLELQLMSFPRPKRWDIMDAFAYVIEMMDIGDRWFEPPAYEDPEAEFEELEFEPEFQGWRVA